MSEVTLRRRIATLVVAAFLSVMGATLAAVTVADSGEAQPRQCVNGAGCIGYHNGD